VAGGTRGRSGARHERRRVRLGLSKPLVVAVAAVIGLAGAGTAAYEVAGRGSAHAEPRAPRRWPAPVTLEASAKPASVVYGATVDVVATLIDATGVPVAGQRVEVLAARSDTPRNAAVVASGATDAAGRVAASFRPAASSDVWLRYAGSGEWAPTVSLVSHVEVAQRITLTGSARSVAVGRWVATLRGTVSPVVAGQRLRVERRLGGTWKLEAMAPVSAQGAFTFSRQHTTAGTHDYRVVRPRDASFGESVATVGVRIRARSAPAPGTPVVVGPRGAVGTRLLVTGDSLAFYLGQQVAAARKDLATTVDSKHSSGLARPDFFDWTANARRQVSAYRPSSVVLFLGGNDCQPLRRNGNGAWASVGTAAWSAEYQRRAAELMRVYTESGARVFWLGLPIARANDIASCYRMLNAATTAAARSVPNVAWSETWSLYTVDGRYSDVVNGVRARQEDGIHFTFEGTRFATRMVLGLLARR
jgi:hypothetical protein